MKRVCDICGAEQDERWMVSFSSGRKTHWLCWDCFKIGQYEASMNEFRRRVAIFKEMKSRGIDT